MGELACSIPKKPLEMQYPRETSGYAVDGKRADDQRRERTRRADMFARAAANALL